MGAPKGDGRHLAQADPFDLAGSDQIGQCADRVLDRHHAIDAMQIEQINHIDPQTPQAFVASLHHRFGAGVHPRRAATLVENHAELRGHNQFARAALQRATQQFLAAGIHRRRIEEIDTEIDGTVDQNSGIAGRDASARSVIAREAETPQSQGRY